MSEIETYNLQKLQEWAGAMSKGFLTVEAWEKAPHRNSLKRSDGKVLFVDTHPVSGFVSDFFVPRSKKLDKRNRKAMREVATLVFRSMNRTERNAGEVPADWYTAYSNFCFANKCWPTYK